MDTTSRTNYISHVLIIIHLLQKMSRNHLDQKLKLVVEAPRYFIYFNMPPHKRTLWVRSMDAAQALVIPDAKYSTLNEGYLRFKPVTSCHVSF